MIKIFANCIITPTEDSVLLPHSIRVLEIDKVKKLATIIEYSRSPTKPQIIELKLLEAEVNSSASTVTIAQTPDFMLKHEDDISATEKRKREQRWGLISGFIAGRSPGAIIADKDFGKKISAHAKSLGVDRKKIYRVLFRYWAMGQVKNSLLSDTTLIGRTPERTIKATLGRPAKYRGVIVEDSAITLTNKDLISIRVAYDRYRNRKSATIRDAYEWMLKKHYSKALPNGQHGEIIRGTYPTLRQMRYHGQKMFDAMYVLRGRKGTIRWDKDYRGLNGTASDGLHGACHRFELDSTIADVYLVHRIHRSWLIGRPVLYVVVDTYSRMIVGVHVALEGPNWNGARHALFNAFTKKIDFCKRYNIDITDEEWPCHHLPIEVSADRAEMLSGAAEAMSNSLDVAPKIAPPFRPDWKAIVESRFKLINDGLELKFLPGGVDARMEERGDRKYELDAIYDIDQFTEMVILAILSHNSNLRLPHLLDKEMLGAGFEPTPINIWNWSIENSPINTRTHSTDDIKIALLPSTEAPIRRGGIFFKGLLFTCKIAAEEQWSAHSHNGKTRYIRVWYDPNCVDNAWIKVSDSFIPLSLTPTLGKKYSGYRLEEIEDVLAAVNQVSPDESFRVTQDNVRRKDRLEEITNEALRLRDEAPRALSKSDFKSDIKTKRGTEATVETAKHTLALSEMHDSMTKEADISGRSRPRPVENNLSTRGKNFLKLVTSNAKNQDKQNE